MYYYVTVNYPDIVDSSGNVYGETYTIYYNPDTEVFKWILKAMK